MNQVGSGAAALDGGAVPRALGERAGAETRRIWLGIAWGMAAALTTAGWWVMTRLGVSHSLDQYDLTALRFGISGLLLLPVLWAHRRAVGRVSPWLLAVIAIGAGAPFAPVNGTGLTFASAGNGGAIMPGMLPLFAALLSVAVLGERVSVPRRWGLAIIVGGIAAIAGHGLTAGLTATPGHALFLLGALLWAAFSVALRRSGLAPLPAVAVVCVASLVGYVPSYMAVAGTAMAAAPWEEILPQALFQGILSPLTALCFANAVVLLGAARSAVFGALVPVLATVLGALALAEMPSLLESVGVVAVSAGAYLAAGATLRWRRGARRN